MTHTATFRSMGCDVIVQGGDLAVLVALFAEREARVSRFAAASELNRVNARPYGADLLTPEFAAMVELALDAARTTGGLVTPAVGAAIVAAGYDRDFDTLPLDGPQVEAAPVPALDTLSLKGRLLFRTEAMALDLNGVVKGRTIDDVLAASSADWVSAGGDLATRVPLHVDLPGGEMVMVTAGGLATSSVGRRRWLRGGEEQHHLIDPSTGRPADTPWRDVTVAAGSCIAADVAAKAALLLGDRGPAWLDARGLPGRFVAHSGRVRVNEAWFDAVPLEAAA
jgi:thiamine biosynthesis lipoprotein